MTTFYEKNRININHYPGHYDAKSAVIGSRVEDLRKIHENISRDPFLSQFEKALYYEDASPSFVHLIPAEQKQKSEEFAHAIFVDYIKKYEKEGINENNALWWNDTGPKGEVVIKEDNYRNYLGWHVYATARKKNNYSFELEGNYLPVYLTAYHEFQHVEETPSLASRIFYSLKGGEILPTLKTIILSDEIFKKIYEKGLDSEIDYGKSLHVSENTIPIGRLANIYRHLEEKYSSLSEALLSTESFEFLKKKNF